MEHIDLDKFNIDGLRFIDSLHTTNRQLGVCTTIIREVKDRQIPKRILFDKLIAWSREQEITNSSYHIDKGKITNNGKPTTAINHYLKLCESFGLLSKFGEVYTVTRISYILSYFDTGRLKLSLPEKLFYSYLLMTIDADGLILILQVLNSNKFINQKDFQKTYSHELTSRLQYKRQFSSGTAKFNIANKLRKVQLLWKNPEKYAEHMIAPRSEWLKVIGLVKIDRIGGVSSYSLTDLGEIIYDSIPNIHLNQLGKDINNRWIEEHFFSVFGKIAKGSRNFSNALDDHDKLLNAFDLALAHIRSSNSFRLPLLDTFLFICIYMLDKYIININLADLKAFFEEGVVFKGKKFFIKGGGRMNESYITSILC